MTAKPHADRKKIAGVVIGGVTGSEVELVEAFAAWSLIRALGSIPITPAASESKRLR